MFKLMYTLREHTDWVRRLHFDSMQAVSSSYDCTLKVWDLKTAKCKMTLTGHKGCVNCFQYDETRVPCLGFLCLIHCLVQLVSGSGDKEIKIWDMNTGICLKSLKGH